MNIYSSYRKLNDYKGASCGQLSALSTQHSALSSVFNAIINIRTVLALFLAHFFLIASALANTGIECYCENADTRRIGESRVSSPEEACNVLNGEYNHPVIPAFTSTSYNSNGTYIVSVSADYDQGFCVGTLTVPRGGIGLTYAWSARPRCYAQRDHYGSTYTTGLAFSDFRSSPCLGATTLSLTPAPYQNEPRPKEIEGKDGKSTFDLIAKVTENGSPKAGVAVTFTSKVEANSGGHDHHDASRPKGDVPASGITENNGEVRVTFQAPLFAGTHTVEATCNSCSNKTVTHSLDVKVLNLTQLTGGGSGALYKLIGDDGNHGSNHWFSYKAKDALKQLLTIFDAYGWGIVGVNDSSLMWGGCFDVSGRWGSCKSNHAGHRTGEEVDLSFYRPAGVSKDLRKRIYDHLKDNHKIEMPTILWHLEDKPNPDPTKPPKSYAHFHVYLLGQKQFATTPY